ncbi:MAG: DUF4401 domain-containing protein [Burkholderiales bacterium]
MSPALPDTVDPAHDRPLAISLLLGASGWFAGLFMLAFVAMLFQPDNAGQAAVCAIVLLAAAWGLFKADGDGAQVFVAQLGLTLSIAGQCLMLYAMSEHANGIAPIASAALLLQAVLALAMPNRLHRTLSTLFATIAWALTLRFALFGEPEFWRSNGPTHTASLQTALAGWLAAWLPVGAGLWWLIRGRSAWAVRGGERLLQPITTGLIVGLGFATLASQPFESFRWFGSGEVDAGSLALWPLLSAFAALGAVAAAFALRRRGLMSVCVIAALGHVSHFYYALGTSLLVKSLLMLVIGAAMLVAARALTNKETA